MQFIEQTGFEALLHDAGGADNNVLIPGGVLRLANSTFNSIGDKRKRRSFRGPFLWNCMSDNKARRSRRVAAPGLRDIKGSAPPHAGTVVCERLIQNLSALR